MACSGSCRPSVRFTRGAATIRRPFVAGSADGHPYTHLRRQMSMTPMSRRRALPAALLAGAVLATSGAALAHGSSGPPVAPLPSAAVPRRFRLSGCAARPAPASAGAHPGRPVDADRCPAHAGAATARRWPPRSPQARAEGGVLLEAERRGPPTRAEGLLRAACSGHASGSTSTTTSSSTRRCPRRPAPRPRPPLPDRARPRRRRPPRRPRPRPRPSRRPRATWPAARCVRPTARPSRPTSRWSTRRWRRW